MVQVLTNATDETESTGRGRELSPFVQMAHKRTSYPLTAALGACCSVTKDPQMCEYEGRF
jgi:hypothetical protein